MSQLSLMGLAESEDSGSRIDWKDKAWMKDYEMVLATNENLSGLIDECINAGKYGLDLETTGLDGRVFPMDSPNGVTHKTKDVIVGVCLAPKGAKRGFYIPLRHKEEGREHNVSYSLFVKEFMRLANSEAIAVFHNGKFDQEFLEWPGHAPLATYDDHKRWEDTYVLAYLRNPKQKGLGLKKLSKEELGKEMIELSELYPKEVKTRDFSQLDPSNHDVLCYACSDGICTVELEEKIRNQALILKGKNSKGKHHTQDVVYAIEKLCIVATRWMERNRLHVDLKKVAELIQLAQNETITSLDKMYLEASKSLSRDITPLYHYLLKLRIAETNADLEASREPENKLKSMIEASRSEASKMLRQYQKEDVGLMKRANADPYLKSLLNREKPDPRKGIDLLSEYDIMSGQKLGILLFDLGLPDLKRTDSGQIATDKTTLEWILKDERLKKKFPFLSLVKWFRENQNAMGKLEALFEDTHLGDNTLKVKFKNLGTDTGRFASPGDKKHKTSGGTRFNLQSIPATYDPDRPPSLLRLRECISARPGKVLAAVDFSGVELRIVSNLSGEPKWIKAFFSCSSCGLAFDRGEKGVTPPPPPKYCPKCGSDKIGDIHTMTALAIYGDKAQDREDWKKLRGNGKSTNFALSYGGSGKAVVRSTGCSENEGYRIKKQFDATYNVLRDWWAIIKKEAKKNKYVLTAFGRMYPLPDIDHEDGKWRSKAERNATNAPIQGGSADITKLAMAKIYVACKERGWLEKVLMVATMHDELVFEIDFDILEEALEVITETMANNKALRKRKWPVPLTLDVELGFDWSVPWELYEIQHAVSLRKQLENPELTDKEIVHLLKRLLQVKKKAKLEGKGLESIQWPEPLRPYFKGAQDEITPEGLKALQKAYDILFHKKEVEPTPEPVEAPVVEPMAPQDPSSDLFIYKLPENLSIDFALRLSMAILNSASDEGKKLIVKTSEDFDVTPEGQILVDPEEFLKAIKEIP